LRRWIPGLHRDQRAAVKIAGARLPGPALPTAAVGLIERDEPVAFDSGFVSEKVGVGRAGLLDDTDAAQNSDPAARSVSAPSGPISR
jgi:hypothetical protein